MTGSLHGKAALVTGGSRGIGAATVLRLAAEGADVALTYQHSADQANALVDQVKALGRRAMAVQADSADSAAVTAAVNAVAAEFGRLDILVNNAGVGANGPLEEVPLEEVDRLLAVNVRAVVVGVQAAIPHLGQGGRIISIGSCLAERVAFPGMSLYSMSKSALIGLTKGLSRELGPRGITVNMVNPGATDTDMNPADGPFADSQKALTSAGRYAQPTEIAATIAHLAGPNGAYISGTSIAVDGGLAA